MISVLLFIVGILLALIGLAASIALHEVGHLVPAKLFKVRVPQYMIGFGPTLWSKRIGETEYGLKAIPLGGYISMIGMFPPKHRGEAPRDGGTGFLNTMIEEARSASNESIEPHEVDRTFYNLPVWKRLVIMAGGPLMNLVLAVILFLIVFSGFGIFQSTTTVDALAQCVVAQKQQDEVDASTCSTPSPAVAAGMQPGDEIVAIDGRTVTGWPDVSATIAASAGVPLEITVLRGGAETTLTVTPAVNTVYQRDEFTNQILEDDAGNPLTKEVGFVGFYVTQERQQMPPAYALEFTGRYIGQVGQIIISMPERVVDMWNAGFMGAERDPNGPMSVVGVGRITGEVAAEQSIPVGDRAATIIMLLASLNVALGVMNLIPLPPLDGGHIAAAIVDGLRRMFAKLFRRPPPGYFDTAKLIPVTMVVSVLLMAMTALFVYVDLVNPVRFLE